MPENKYRLPFGEYVVGVVSFLGLALMTRTTKEVERLNLLIFEQTDLAQLSEPRLPLQGMQGTSMVKAGV